MELLLFRLYYLIYLIKLVNASQCDAIFDSKQSAGNKRGMFQSPKFPQKYPPSTRCTYKFLAKENEKVVIKFEHFNIEGLLPGCDKDFLDIFIQQKTISEPLIDGNSQGRFCGHKLEHVPNTVISLYNIIVLDFYSDNNTQRSYNQDDHMGLLGFNGTFNFIPNSPYFPGNIKHDFQNNCNFIIDSQQQKEGPITSPTYPGIYPSHLNCTYLLLGQPNERIRLSFRDIDLNNQDETCVDDYLMVIDGKTESSPIIGERFCGTQYNLKIFSTSNYILILFVSGDFVRRNRYHNIHNPDSKMLQRKGFKFIYQFNSEFLKITPSISSHHIRGTECDMWIKSSGKSSGVVSSPYYPDSRMPSNKVCTYFLYGIHNRQKMETAVLNFDYLDIPPSTDNNCTTGSITIYSIRILFMKIKIRPEPLLLPQKPDNIICGTDTRRLKEIRCKGPLVMLRLNSSNAFSTGIGGFKLRYIFKRDYGIEGRMATTDTCHFIYDISEIPSGVINSPFYNRLYPANTTCQYDLIGNSSHSVRVFFEVFSLSDLGVIKQSYHWIRNTTCDGDMINVAETVPNNNRGSTEIINVAKLCGNSVPGPIVNDIRSKGITLTFKSDSTESHSGFLANFDFLSKSQISKYNCGGLISSNSGGGIITSQRYPRRYWNNLVCDWTLRSNNKNSRILIHFYDFVMEGSQQSCANAVLRIYNDDDFEATSELCGTDSAIPAFVSKSNSVRLRFISSQKSLGQKGFKLVWAEILSRSPDGACPGFECLNTKHCISKRLECDDIPHCGTYSQTQGNLEKYVVDDSDEKQSCPVPSSYNLLHVGLGIIITMIVLILLVVYVLYKEHRKQQNKSITTFVEDIPDGKLHSGNNVLHMGQLNPPLPILCPQQYCHPHSDVMSLPLHYNSGSSLSRPPSYLSQTLTNSHNHNRHSKEVVRKVALRRAHSTKLLQQPNHDSHFKPITDSYKNMSYIAKSQNCNLDNDHNFDLLQETNFFPQSVNTDDGTWTREKMQKISMV